MATKFLNLSVLIGIILGSTRPQVVLASGLYYMSVYKIVNDVTLGYFLHETRP